MKIEQENGTVQFLIPNSSADEMLENDNDSLRDRVTYLEKKIIEHNDEITCLRSTLADALRRINSMETNKGISNGSRSTLIKDVHNSGFKLRGSATDVRDAGKRNNFYPSGKSANSTPTPTRSTRRPAVQYRSTSSLYSDGQSSSSASPAPSPSPTSANNSYNVNPLNKIQTPQTLVTPTQNRLQQGSLSKRWASTSDFSSPTNHAFGTSYKNNVTPALSVSRKTNSSSLHNLSTLRVQIPGSRAWKEAKYYPEEGVVKFYLRGRPFNLHIPSHLRESYHPQGPSNPPGVKLKLEWAYGYRGKDCRNNLYQLPTGEIVYFVAAVAVLYNPEEQTQRHYLGHTEDIKCLAVHPNKLMVATGQTSGHDRRDGSAHIRIWDSVNLVTHHVIGVNELERSVSCLAFSKTDGGGLLVAIDEATDHNMSIWDWSRGERGFKLIETKCSADQVLAVEFSPLDRNTIITCGRNQLSFWLYENGMMMKKVGIFENRDRPKYVTAISFSETGNVISGDSSGSILLWQRGGNRVEKTVKNAHDGPIFSIFVQKDGTIISGGKDGRILEWSRDLRPSSRYIMLPEIYGAPRVIGCGKGSRFIVGTTRNCILAGTFSLPLQPFVQGHTEELWALAVHPNQYQFLTSGYDKTCYLWDTMSKTVVWRKELADPIQSVAFSPYGEVIVLGTSKGKWYVMDSETREFYAQHVDGADHIQVLRFSPNGRSLAVGSRDSNIYIYQVSEDCKKYSRVGRCQGHSSYVTHLDWSSDNQFIQSNSGDYELLYWNAVLCRQIVQTAQMKDVEWATQTCTLGFSTIGIWPEGDGSEVNCCSKANSKPLLATGDDMGKVKLFSSPACYQKCRPVESSGHSSHVTSVEFLHDDSRLLSTGGKDSAIMQWSFGSVLSFAVR